MRSARIRPTVSIGPPAANGTTRVTARLGKSCVAAGAVAPINVAAAAINLMTDMSCLLLGRSTHAMADRRRITGDPRQDEVAAAPHSALMPACLTTSRHLADS